MPTIGARGQGLGIRGQDENQKAEAKKRHYGQSEVGVNAEAQREADGYGLMAIG